MREICPQYWYITSFQIFHNHELMTQPKEHFGRYCLSQLGLQQLLKEISKIHPYSIWPALSSSLPHLPHHIHTHTTYKERRRRGERLVKGHAYKGGKGKEEGRGVVGEERKKDREAEIRGYEGRAYAITPPHLSWLESDVHTLTHICI